MIQYITHNNIDKQKWDLCIAQSRNSMVYAYSWYLDQVAPGWDALVIDNYEAVFPLTHHKKGLSYLYQPFFSQQLGLFSKTRQGLELINKVLEAIPAHFRYIDIQLNSANHVDEAKYPVRKKKNFVLWLDKPHAKLHKEYNDHTRRNLKKAVKHSMHLGAMDAAAAVDFYQKHKGRETYGVAGKHYESFKRVLAEAGKRGFVLCQSVSNDKGEVIACGIFITHADRVLYSMGAASAEGREKRAMYWLIDQVIMRFSEQKVWLDFEGSEIPGVARFFKGFGAERQYYPALRINRLPWLLRWIKS